MGHASRPGNRLLGRRDEIHPARRHVYSLRRTFRGRCGLPLEAQGQTQCAAGRRYPNTWPLNARAIKRIARALEPYDYDKVYSAFWNMRILEDGKGAVARSVARYLKAIAD